MHDVEPVMRLIKAASLRMQEMGVAQWDDEYPAAQDVLSDVAEGTLYVVEDGGEIHGVITLNEHQDVEYKAVAWQCSAGTPLVIHRLCVGPHAQGRGVAKVLMAFAESFATQHGYPSIRLDCFTQNPISNRLYSRLGYAKVGVVTFRKGRFNCYEKQLRP